MTSSIRSSNGSTILFVLSLIVVLFIGGASRAEEAPDNQAIVTQLNAQAKKLFVMRKFRESASIYEAAFKISSKPKFLFNMGQCYKRLHQPADWKKSIFYFKGFLSYNTNPRARELSEKYIAKLQERLDRLPSDAPVPEVGEDEPSKYMLNERLTPKETDVSAKPAIKSAFYKTWWFWTVVGVAVVGGSVATGLALSENDPWVATDVNGRFSPETL